MNLEYIPRKTDKGRAEVETRAFRVGHRERSVLIMVDGKTPAKVLLAKLAFMKKADAILEELRVGGFIDMGSHENARPPNMFATAIRATPLTQDLRARRQYARNFVIEALGPAGDDLAIKLETCDSREALLMLLEKCRAVIESGAGRQRAQEFWSGLGRVAISTVAPHRLVA